MEWNGFLSVLKPPGMSSGAVVGFVRHRLPKGTRVGHGGTLDPDAAGVLPLCVGRATRLFDYIIDKRKEYIAEMCLGVITDTQDITGTVLCRTDASEVDQAQVRAVLPAFVGDILQTPPAYSAIKRDGRRMYDLARQGQAPELTPRTVHVAEIEYLGDMGKGRHMLRIVCGKGVYIRTLCHDVGKALGVGGCMTFLLRSKAGVFDLAHSATLEEIDEAARAGVLNTLLIPSDAPLQHIPAVHVPNHFARTVKNGNPLRRDMYEGEAKGTVRVYLGERFAGVGVADESGFIRFRAMLMEMNECV